MDAVGDLGAVKVRSYSGRSDPYDDQVLVDWAVGVSISEGGVERLQSRLESGDLRAASINFGIQACQMTDSSSWETSNMQKRLHSLASVVSEMKPHILMISESPFSDHKSVEDHLFRKLTDKAAYDLRKNGSYRTDEDLIRTHGSVRYCPYTSTTVILFRYRSLEKGLQNPRVMFDEEADEKEVSKSIAAYKNTKGQATSHVLDANSFWTFHQCLIRIEWQPLVVVDDVPTFQPMQKCHLPIFVFHVPCKGVLTRGPYNSKHPEALQASYVQNMFKHVSSRHCKSGYILAGDLNDTGYSKVSQTIRSYLTIRDKYPCHHVQANRDVMHMISGEVHASVNASVKFKEDHTDTVQWWSGVDKKDHCMVLVDFSVQPHDTNITLIESDSSDDDGPQIPPAKRPSYGSSFGCSTVSPGNTSNAGSFYRPPPPRSTDQVGPRVLFRDSEGSASAAAAKVSPGPPNRPPPAVTPNSGVAGNQDVPDAQTDAARVAREAQAALDAQIAQQQAALNAQQQDNTYNLPGESQDVAPNDEQEPVYE